MAAINGPGDHPRQEACLGNRFLGPIGDMTHQYKMVWFMSLDCQDHSITSHNYRGVCTSVTGYNASAFSMILGHFK